MNGRQLTMKKSLFIYTVLIIFTGLAGFFGASVYITHNNNFNIAMNSVIEIAGICANLYSEETDLDSFVQVGNDTRITVIAPDGTVLADSRPLDLGAVENHLDRPEVLSAADGNPTAYVRYSDTLSTDLMYYALKVELEDDYVFVRAAVPVAQINAYLFRSLPLLILIFITLTILCFVFISKMAGRITKPFNSIENKLRSLSHGEYTTTPFEKSYEELDRIILEIDAISLVLQNSFDSLSSEKSKLDYILDNIGDGIFTINESGNITLINTSALSIFDVTFEVVGKGMIYLSSDKALTEAIRDCITTKKTAMFETTLTGKIFFVTVKRLPGTDLSMAVLSDVTENRENAKRREVFFANASHELKTPLTAIKGFNELTSINNKDEKITKYLGSITRETDRMLSLIGDMLKLSELENSQNLSPVPVSLLNTINEVRDTMSTMIDEKSILFIMVDAVEDSAVIAEQGHVYELVKNLIENAVRYSNPSSEVSVSVQNVDKVVRLTISDNGIGIPEEEQSRIFERFYRVEKSRSQRNGGTGLGLSIVKHICALYSWRLSLKSKIGSGTEVVVEFGGN
jgi:two-component system phosphate regulon sensor histidine kinase PhoR